MNLTFQQLCMMVEGKASPDDVLALFHHIHHDNGVEKVHHCGGAHVKVDPKVNYTIDHCKCGKHSIDKKLAVGHASDPNSADPVEVKIRFTEKCPKGGWHVESGVVKKTRVNESATLTDAYSELKGLCEDLEDGDGQ